MKVPTSDQSYCDVGQHAPVCSGCSGYTEDEADPETCTCSCHDPIPQPRQETPAHPIP